MSLEIPGTSHNNTESGNFDDTHSCFVNINMDSEKTQWLQRKGARFSVGGGQVQLISFL